MSIPFTVGKDEEEFGTGRLGGQSRSLSVMLVLSGKRRPMKIDSVG